MKIVAPLIGQVVLKVDSNIVRAYVAPDPHRSLDIESLETGYHQGILVITVNSLALHRGFN